MIRIRGLFVFNSTVYFFAKTTAHGVELWKTDGTNAGTVEIKDIDAGTNNSYDHNHTIFFANNNILYFNANDGTHGTELWKTDGTSSGTVLIKDINAGTDSSDCENFTALGTSVIFSATDATHGTELWETDGTSAGTVLLKDIISGTKSSTPQQFVLFQNKIFFLTESSVFSLPVYNLYSTDGTTAGTSLVKSFGTLSVALLTTSIILNNKLYFSAFVVGKGLQLWSTDGTTAGTLAFTDLNTSDPIGAEAVILPDIFNINGNYHTRSFNGKILFAANDGIHGEELWITDGTEAGTSIVKDINPGADSSLYTDNSEFGISWYYTTTDFYFTANDGTHGTELYKTDGTSNGTSLVEDLNPGIGGSNPYLFMFLNNHIYFTADNGDNADGDRDLYIIDASVTLPVSLVNFTASLDNKAVDLNWTSTTEINTKNYTIQRSYTGLQFQNIGSVNAAGNSSKKLSYQFTDADALSTNTNKIYYRLQITDNDGKVSVSSIAAVNISSNGNLLVLYPNPVKDNLVLISKNNTGKATIRISNANGKVVLTKQLENVQAENQNKINVAALPKGVYYLEFLSDNSKQTTRFIKY